MLRTLGIDFSYEGVRLSYVDNDCTVKVFKDKRNNSLIKNNMLFDSSSNSFIFGNYYNANKNRDNSTMIEYSFSNMIFKNNKNMKFGKYYFSPIEICGLYFQSIKDFVQREFKDTIKNVVISLPSCLNSTKRVQISQSAQIAGLKLTCLTNNSVTAIKGVLKDIKEDKFVLLYYSNHYIFAAAYEVDSGIVQNHAISERIEDDEVLNEDDALYVINNLFCDNSLEDYFNHIYIADLIHVEDDIEKFIFKLYDSKALKSIKNVAELHFINDAENIICKGAAIQAVKYQYDEVSNMLFDKVVLDIMPFSYSIGITNQESFLVIPKGVVYPCKYTHIFRTAHIFQRDADTRIVAGESENLNENEQIGYLEFLNIRRSVTHNERFSVDFRVDNSGILDVRAKAIDQSGDIHAYITTNSYMEDKDIIDSMEKIKEIQKDEGLTMVF